MVFTPILFAGVIFALSFSRSAEPDLAFGANIAGAMLGGLRRSPVVLGRPLGQQAISALGETLGLGEMAYGRWQTAVQARPRGGELTRRHLSYKLSYMRKRSVSIRELQQNLRQVMARVERGQIIEITRRSRPVARLAPLRPTGSISPWPDLEERARAVFGRRTVTPGAAELVIADRGEQ